jgi:biopolymer transport protein ExbB
MSFAKKLNSLAATLLVISAFAIAPAHAQAPASAPEAAAPAPAVAPAPAPATAPAATVTKETVENPYDLKHLWAQGDVVARGTLIILVIMSLASWYVLVTKLFESFKLSTEAKAARQTFFKSASLQEGIKTLKAGSAFQFIAESGVEAGKDHAGELTANIDRNTWIGMSVQRAIENVQSRLQDGLAVLATVGSTAPFVGLFGTVWGILNALTAIGIAGQASIDKVAGPVGESLLMTAIGLAVAVPAVLGYNWLVRRNKVTMESVRSFGADLHGILLGSRASVR